MGALKSNFSTGLETALLGLRAECSDVGGEWPSGAKISQALLREHGVRLHWRTIDRLFADAGELVARRKRKSRWEYFILHQGQSLLSAESPFVSLIDPENAIKSMIRLQAFLSDLDPGVVKVCDPFVDSSTFDFLSLLKKDCVVRLLSKKIMEEQKVRLLLRAASAEGRLFEIRKAADLHDRYIITQDRMLILGTSLNSFGRNISFIVRPGRDIRASTEVKFDQIWEGGRAF
ncbi:hypothetical protein K2X33_13615 [bacterium]|nr:hypothetical protein [bacterium]